MTGAELRRIMKMRRIKTAEAAHALDIHPQTIRNLWAKDEVPRLYLMALTTYVWALGQESQLVLNPNPKGVGMDPKMMDMDQVPTITRAQIERGVKAGLKPGVKIPSPPPMRNNESAGGDLWSKLK